MQIERILIYTFIVTALYDVVLRFMALNYDKLPKFFQSFKFIKFLNPYFKKHTLLAAALIAGFVGFVTQALILYISPFPSINKFDNKTIMDILKFLLLTFVVSALYGIPMKTSGLFPHLDDTYYKSAGVFGGMWYDGFSGIIVQSTILFLFYIKLLR